MKRYPSIDFLRGLAIFIMIFLHSIMRWLDQGAVEDAVNDGTSELIFVILYIVFLFLGGWAGFFLMVSAIGNMISMYKGLKRGLSPNKLIMRQIIGGCLLLVFAFLSEGVIGYHGALGDLVLGYDNWFNTALYRGYHVETIHAVAWCVIINGIVQGILSRNGGFKNIKKNIKIYAILAVVVVALTQFVWWGMDAISPTGDFSDGIYSVTGHPWFYGDLLKDTWYMNILKVFLAPLAGIPEPIFPFLAVSFIGSIIGLYLMQVSEQEGIPSRKPLKMGMWIAFIMVMIGVTACVIGLVTMSGDIFTNLTLLLNNGYSVPGIENAIGIIWLPWFLLLTGTQLGLILLIFRLVEFRGKAEVFAKKTTMFRRFGLVAFSVYNFEFLDVLITFPLSLIPGFPAYQTDVYDRYLIWVPVILIILFWHGFLKLWEKVNYVFGLEWFIAKISEKLIPMKKSEVRYPWWKTPRLDPVASLYNADWINVVEEDQVDHKTLTESKLAKKVALCGYLFFPGFWVGIGIAKRSQKIEGINKHNKVAIVNGIIGTIIVILLLITTMVITTAIL
ncbi:MAG: heparan-alpha-glucosaminide N-acetyltransferase domain-containing protein [Promethearchaeota archaeon]